MELVLEGDVVIEDRGRKSEDWFLYELQAGVLDLHQAAQVPADLGSQYIHADLGKEGTHLSIHCERLAKQVRRMAKRLEERIKDGD